MRRMPVTLLLCLLINAPSALSADSNGDELLNRLIGSWALTGSMGDTELNQRVDARWVVQGRFVEMHVLGEASGESNQPYEALYLIGYDDQADTYVFHLFDTFGPSYSRTIGIGERAGDAIEFLFEYPGALFSNTFIWDKGQGQWTMLLRQKQENGEWSTFATKILTRIDGK